MKLLRTGQINKTKKLLGENNHFLVTILVGLNQVELDKCPRKPSFSPSWDPKDVFASARKSREHVLNMSLAWVVDSFDGYIKSLVLEPCILSHNETISAFKGRSINDKLRNVKVRFYSNQLTVPLALAQLAIWWRNKLVHSLVPSKLDAGLKSFFVKNAASISTHYKGLDIHKLIDDYEQGRDLTHKGVGAFIKGVLDLIMDLDERVVSKTSPDKYAFAVLETHLKNNPHFRNLWDISKESLKKKKIMALLLANHFELGDGARFDDFFNFIKSKKSTDLLASI